MERDILSLAIGMVAVVGSYLIGRNADRAAHEEALKIVQKWQHDEVQRIHASYAMLLERACAIAQYGQPTTPAAAIQDPAPDAETVIRQSIRQQTIERGMKELRAMYAASGIPVSDDEIKEDAEMMLSGLTPPDRRFIEPRPIGDSFGT